MADLTPSSTYGVDATINGPTWGPVVTLVGPPVVSAGAAPAGITFDIVSVGGGSNKLIILGAPAELGFFSYTISTLKSDASTLFTTVDHTVALMGGCPFITIIGDLDEFVADVPQSANLGASDGVAPFVWSVIDGSLPTGLSLSADGVVDGTATTPGTYDFTIGVEDDNGCPGVRIYSLVIAAAARTQIRGDTQIKPGTVTETVLGLLDVTTLNVSTSKHGFAPKAPGDATKFLNGANPPAWAVPSGSGGALVQIAQVVTSGSQATVDFSSIPAGYSALVVEFVARDTQGGTGLATQRLKINNDATAGNYTSVGSTGVANAVAVNTNSASSTKGFFCFGIPQDGNTAGIANAGRIEIVGYASTTWHKRMTGHGGYESTTNGLTTLTVSGRWASTAAINQLTFGTDGTAFKDGSVFTLYGVQ